MTIGRLDPLGTGISLPYLTVVVRFCRSHRRTFFYPTVTCICCGIDSRASTFILTGLWASKHFLHLMRMSRIIIGHVDLRETIIYAILGKHQPGIAR